MRRQRIRWGDNDRFWGPFTYASGDHRRFAIVLGSGDDEDYPGCRLRVSVGSRTLILALPPIIKPSRKWVDTSRYEWSRGPGSGYWSKTEREYGFTYSEGFLSVMYGRQTHASDTEQRWGYFPPWLHWRHVRHSMYGLDGEHFWTEPRRKKGENHDIRSWLGAKEQCPSRTFAFLDYDDDPLTARTIIEEREWLFGERWCKWLSLFRKPKVRRSLDIRFSGETGPRKGSWKGGTVGHSIDMLPGELHESAFRRYCAENGMTFLGPAKPELVTA